MNISRKTPLEALIEEHYSAFTKAEKRVADYALSNIKEIGNLSAQDIGAYSGAGAATVVRFCRKCGFIGLSDLKASLIRGGGMHVRSEDIYISPEDSLATVKQKVLDYHISVVNSLKTQRDEEKLNSAVDALLNAKRVVVSGAGDSSSMAIILHNNLDMQGLETYYANDPVQELAYITRLSPMDVMIGFSYTGRFRLTVNNLEAAHQLGIKTIGILGTQDSIAEQYLDIILYSNAEQKEYYFGSQTSMIGDFALIELLTTMLAARRPPDSEHTKLMRDLIEMHRIPKENNL